MKDMDIKKSIMFKQDFQRLGIMGDLELKCIGNERLSTEVT